ncbi:DUF885 domain-containing protein [Membranicola marinus]|uniref:DUF885 domain-containing protein n=1 Tax=Membranihabitans marinus TaxID=1227546 RepID=A0A953HM50_9BACT|nr:DUF885 family protein [Membranihabitans marinus]MBY5957038.1 DUF885 domain-containing protein [Membranihabitans marinus]
MKQYYVPLILSIYILLSCQTVASAQESTIDHGPSMVELIQHFREDRGALHRYYHIEASPVHRKRLIRFYENYRERLEEIHYAELSVSDQVDFQLLMREITDKDSQLKEEMGLYAQLRSWIQAGDPLYRYETLRRRGHELNREAFASDLYQISQAYQDHMQQLKKEKPTFTKQEINYVSQVLKGHQEVLKSLNQFYQGYDPDYDWWVKEPAQRLKSVIENYDKVFRTRLDSSRMNVDDGSGITGVPAGRTEIIRQLERDMIPYSPEELIEIAQKEFAWCDQELLKVSQEMGFGTDWKAAQEKVKQSYVPPGEQPALMLRLYQESVDFIKDHDLISIPPLAEETWRMNMLSARRQLISPFFLGGESLLISYPTQEMDHDQKMMSMRGNNPHFARAVVHHEIIPGHHLQQFMNRRYKIHRRYLFGTPFWTEGWSLYWELLLYEKGFAKTPEDKLGMLFWRMHRCARIIFSLKYHLEEWTPQECIDFLVDRVGHERANAEAEVRRSFTGGYPPLYQLAYMTGGLQFYQLKRELVDSGKMSYREFHDAVLRENAIPLEMLRYILFGKFVPEEFTTTWRFYNK